MDAPNINDVKHEELKQLCKSNKLSQCGTKKVLYERLINAKVYVESENNRLADPSPKTKYEKFPVKDLRAKLKERNLDQRKFYFNTVNRIK